MSSFKSMHSPIFELPSHKQPLNMSSQRNTKIEDTPSVDGYITVSTATPEDANPVRYSARDVLRSTIAISFVASYVVKYGSFITSKVW